jgi:diaminopimelate epimerase
LGPRSIYILIWERGAGETQASGSSACAAAAAAVRLGLVKSPVTVKAPGGALRIKVGGNFDLTMKGPVAEVARGAFSTSFIRTLR